MDREEAARAIVHCCRRLWEGGLIAGADGNVSVRLAPERLLVTPRGALKADLVPDDLVEVDLAGRRTGGSRDASSELDLHLRIYRRLQHCNAVVHAHPPTATGFAVAGQTLDPDVLPEVIALMGRVRLVPYATPGTPALGDLAEPLVDPAVGDALLLANHGAVTWGGTLDLARSRMESLEHAARILLAARAVGPIHPLTPENVAALDRLRGVPRHG